MRIGFGLSLVLGFCLVVQGQEVTGNISGNVVDQAGAALPKAQVTVLNTERNQVMSRTTTDQEGLFTAPLLPIGKYAVTVEAPGFKKITKADIELHVSDRLSFRFEMVVGDVNQSVTVEESALVVQTQNAAAESLLNGTEIRELSLNNRNYIQLIGLLPGVTSNSATDEVYIGTTNPLGSTNTIPFSLNGGRTSANSYLVDGADNIDRGSNLTLLNYPNVEAIAEFKVIRGSYSAEYGRAASGQINVVTRGGGSKFHGSAYEFFRNDKLAANDFFSNSRNIARKPLRYNNFGWALSGPIYIPGHYNKEKNKTFFFFSQEFRRVITYSTINAIAPSEDMKKGIFSQPVCTAFTGNTCTATATTITNINPVAKQYIDKIWSKIPGGDPNNSYNLFSPFRNVYNARQELVRVDHEFNSKFRVFVRFLNDTIPTEEPGGLFTGNAFPGVANTKTDSPGRNWTARSTWVVTPTIINDAGFSYSYGAIVSRITGLMGSDNSPIQVNLPYKSTLARVPAISISGLSGLSGYGPYDDFNRNYNYFDNVTKLAGKHTIKAGISINYYSKTENAALNNAGTLSFTNTPRPTGTLSLFQGWANFLLGNVSSFTQASLDLTPYVRQRQVELYLQDDYRIHPRLTINLGVRYSLFRQPFDSNNLLTNFDPRQFDPSKAATIDKTSGNIVGLTGDYLNGIVINGKNSPYGDKIAPDNKGNWAPRIGLAWNPDGRGIMAIRTGYGIAFDSTLVGIYEQNAFNNPPYVSSISIPNTRFEDPTAGVPSVSSVPKALRGTPYAPSTPYSQQWSFDVVRRFGKSTIFNIGYYGSKGTHLLGIVDLNQIPVGLAVAAGVTDANNPLTSVTTPRINYLRPYPGYTAINAIQNWFNSNYNGLQMASTHQLPVGFLRFTYTYSKALTDATSDRSNAPQNTYNRRADYARANFDRTHVANVFYSLTIPVARNSKGVLAAVAKGWQMSNIFTAQSGLPTRVTSGLGLDWGGVGLIGASASSPRPDLVGNPNANAPRTIAQWFNTSAFAAVPTGVVRPGNAAATTVIGPGLWRFDMSMFKNFRIQEKYALQMRFETFNTFNHTNYLGLGTTLGATNFGQVISTREPRRVQIAAKFTF